MGTIDDYVNSLPNTFDFSSVLDAEFEAIEATKFDRPIIYKYLSKDRRPSFFQRPQLRFSQREALNDPFELRQRWREVRAIGLREFLKNELPKILRGAISDPSRAYAIFEEEVAGEGVSLTFQQKEKARQFIASAKGRQFLDRQLKSVFPLLPMFIDVAFEQFESGFQQAIDRAIGRLGVLSVTEDPFNHQMWAHYASSGTGFVVGLDVSHPFLNFQPHDEPARSLLRKVKYANEILENFWNNPYYLFLVKNAGWSYEAEWRMFKQLSECDETIGIADPVVCLWNLPPELIKEIYFGLHYSPTHVEEDMKSLRQYGATPRFFSLLPNHSSGKLEPMGLTS